MSGAVASDLRAVVVGAGWAGEGHTVALQHAGVRVEGICARDPGAVAAVAGRLGVPHASTDWRGSIASLRPDIVAVATPAVLRREAIELAAATAPRGWVRRPADGTPRAGPPSLQCRYGFLIRASASYA